VVHLGELRPASRNVIFHMPRSSTHTTKWDVWSVPVTGGKPTLLLLRNAAFPITFPEGDEIAFVSPTVSSVSGPRISIADAHGSRRTLVEANAIWYPTISPDGSGIAHQDGWLHLRGRRLHR
jgi:Tol biopolymer transport system component